MLQLLYCRPTGLVKPLFVWGTLPVGHFQTKWEVFALGNRLLDFCGNCAALACCWLQQDLHVCIHVVIQNDNCELVPWPIFFENPTEHLMACPPCKGRRVREQNVNLLIGSCRNFKHNMHLRLHQRWPSEKQLLRSRQDELDQRCWLQGSCNYGDGKEQRLAMTHENTY